jgi:hypothetical protein
MKEVRVKLAEKEKKHIQLEGNWIGKCPDSTYT